jgi:hypothetical protein
MSKATVLVSVIALCAVGLFAQDELAQYQTMMKAGAASNGALRKAVMEKDDAAIKANSEKVADAFEGISKFWTGKNNEAAAKFAMTARDAAKAVGSGDASAMGKIGGTCSGCHAITRDGNKFKAN